MSSFLSLTVGCFSRRPRSERTTHEKVTGDTSDTAESSGTESYHSARASSSEHASLVSHTSQKSTPGTSQAVGGHAFTSGYTSHGYVPHRPLPARAGQAEGMSIEEVDSVTGSREFSLMSALRVVGPLAFSLESYSDGPLSFIDDDVESELERLRDDTSRDEGDGESCYPPSSSSPSLTRGRLPGFLPGGLSNTPDSVSASAPTVLETPGALSRHPSLGTVDTPQAARRGCLCLPMSSRRRKHLSVSFRDLNTDTEDSLGLSLTSGQNYDVSLTSQISEQTDDYLSQYISSSVRDISYLEESCHVHSEDDMTSHVSSDVNSDVSSSEQVTSGCLCGLGGKKKPRSTPYAIEYNYEDEDVAGDKDKCSENQSRHGSDTHHCFLDDGYIDSENDLVDTTDSRIRLLKRYPDNLSGNVNVIANVSDTDYIDDSLGYSVDHAHSYSDDEHHYEEIDDFVPIHTKNHGLMGFHNHDRREKYDKHASELHGSDGNGPPTVSNDDKVNIDGAALNKLTGGYRVNDNESPYTAGYANAENSPCSFTFVNTEENEISENNLKKEIEKRGDDTTCNTNQSTLSNAAESLPQHDDDLLNVPELQATCKYDNKNISEDLCDVGRQSEFEGDEYIRDGTGDSDIHMSGERDTDRTGEYVGDVCAPGGSSYADEPDLAGDTHPSPSRAPADIINKTIDDCQDQSDKALKKSVRPSIFSRKKSKKAAKEPILGTCSPKRDDVRTSSIMDSSEISTLHQQPMDANLNSDSCTHADTALGGASPNVCIHDIEDMTPSVHTGEKIDDLEIIDSLIKPKEKSDANRRRFKLSRRKRKKEKLIIDYPDSESSEESLKMSKDTNKEASAPTQSLESSLSDNGIKNTIAQELDHIIHVTFDDLLDTDSEGTPSELLIPGFDDVSLWRPSIELPTILETIPEVESGSGEDGKYLTAESPSEEDIALQAKSKETGFDRKGRSESVEFDYLNKEQTIGDSDTGINITTTSSGSNRHISSNEEEESTNPREFDAGDQPNKKQNISSSNDHLSCFGRKKKRKTAKRSGSREKKDNELEPRESGLLHNQIILDTILLDGMFEDEEDGAKMNVVDDIIQSEVEAEKSIQSDWINDDMETPDSPTDITNGSETNNDAKNLQVAEVIESPIPDTTAVLESQIHQSQQSEGDAQLPVSNISSKTYDDENTPLDSHQLVDPTVADNAHEDNTDNVRDSEGEESISSSSPVCRQSSLLLNKPEKPTPAKRLTISFKNILSKQRSSSSPSKQVHSFSDSYEPSPENVDAVMSPNVDVASSEIVNEKGKASNPAEHQERRSYFIALDSPESTKRKWFDFKTKIRKKTRGKRPTVEDHGQINHGEDNADVLSREVNVELETVSEKDQVQKRQEEDDDLSDSSLCHATEYVLSEEELEMCEEKPLLPAHSEAINYETSKANTSEPTSVSKERHSPVYYRASLVDCMPMESESQESVGATDQQLDSSSNTSEHCDEDEQLFTPDSPELSMRFCFSLGSKKRKPKYDKADFDQRLLNVQEVLDDEDDVFSNKTGTIQEGEYVYELERWVDNGENDALSRDYTSNDVEGEENQVPSIVSLDHYLDDYRRYFMPGPTLSPVPEEEEATHREINIDEAIRKHELSLMKNDAPDEVQLNDNENDGVLESDYQDKSDTSNPQKCDIESKASSSPSRTKRSCFSVKKRKKKKYKDNKEFDHLDRGVVDENGLTSVKDDHYTRKWISEHYNFIQDSDELETPNLASSGSDTSSEHPVLTSDEIEFRNRSRICELGKMSYSSEGSQTCVKVVESLTSSSSNRISDIQMTELVSTFDYETPKPVIVEDGSRHDEDTHNSTLHHSTALHHTTNENASASGSKDCPNLVPIDGGDSQPENISGHGAYNEAEQGDGIIENIVDDSLKYIDEHNPTTQPEEVNPCCQGQDEKSEIPDMYLTQEAGPLFTTFQNLIDEHSDLFLPSFLIPEESATITNNSVHSFVEDEYENALNSKEAAGPCSQNDDQQINTAMVSDVDCKYSVDGESPVTATSFDKKGRKPVSSQAGDAGLETNNIEQNLVPLEDKAMDDNDSIQTPSSDNKVNKSAKLLCFGSGRKSKKKKKKGSKNNSDLNQDLSPELNNTSNIISTKSAVDDIFADMCVPDRANVSNDFQGNIASNKHTYDNNPKLHNTGDTKIRDTESYIQPATDEQSTVLRSVRNDPDDLNGFKVDNHGAEDDIFARDTPEPPSLLCFSSKNTKKARTKSKKSKAVTSEAIVNTDASYINTDVIEDIFSDSPSYAPTVPLNHGYINHSSDKSIFDDEPDEVEEFLNSLVSDGSSQQSTLKKRNRKSGSVFDFDLFEDGFESVAPKDAFSEMKFFESSESSIPYSQDSSSVQSEDIIHQEGMGGIQTDKSCVKTEEINPDNEEEEEPAIPHWRDPALDKGIYIRQPADSVASTPEVTKKALLCLQMLQKTPKQREYLSNFSLPEAPKKGCLRQPRVEMDGPTTDATCEGDLENLTDDQKRNSGICTCSAGITKVLKPEEDCQVDEGVPPVVHYRRSLQPQDTPEGTQKMCFCVRRSDKTSRSVTFSQDVCGGEDTFEEISLDDGPLTSTADDRLYSSEERHVTLDQIPVTEVTEDSGLASDATKPEDEGHLDETASDDYSSVTSGTTDSSFMRGSSGSCSLQEEIQQERIARWGSFVSEVIADLSCKATHKQGCAKLDALTLKELKDVTKVYLDGICVLDALVKFDHARCLWRLYKRGIDVVGLYPLFLPQAACARANDTAEVLVRLGADVTMRGRDDWKTPLHIAAEMGNVPLMAYLIQNGAKICINDPDKNGSPPITLACMGGSQTAVSALLDFGAAIDACDLMAFPPLHACALLGNIALVVMLIQRGASVNFKDFSGFTPLHHAVYKDHKNVAAYLLHYGADRTVINRQGKTPYHMCRSKEMQMLIKKKTRPVSYRY